MEFRKISASLVDVDAQMRPRYSSLSGSKTMVTWAGEGCGMEPSGSRGAGLVLGGMAHGCDDDGGNRVLRTVAGVHLAAAPRAPVPARSFREDRGRRARSGANLVLCVLARLAISAQVGLANRIWDPSGHPGRGWWLRRIGPGAALETGRKDLCLLADSFSASGAVRTSQGLTPGRGQQIFGALSCPARGVA